MFENKQFFQDDAQTGDMKRRPGNGIEGAMVCTSLGSLLRLLFYFLDDISYPQSVVLEMYQKLQFKRNFSQPCRTAIMTRVA